MYITYYDASDLMEEVTLSLDIEVVERQLINFGVYLGYLGYLFMIYFT